MTYDIVELKLKVLENAVIGLRIGITLNSQTIENNDSLEFSINDKLDNGVISFVPTFEYYFTKNNFRPFLGLGAGVHLISSVDVLRDITNPYKDAFISICE